MKRLRLRPLLKRLVHRLEAVEGAAEGAAEERHEDASERLLLGEADALRGEGLDDEGVLAVEEAGEEHAAQPAQLGLGVAASTRGEKTMGRSPGAPMDTRNWSPDSGLPLIERMKGFHWG